MPSVVLSKEPLRSKTVSASKSSSLLVRSGSELIRNWFAEMLSLYSRKTTALMIRRSFCLTAKSNSQRLSVYWRRTLKYWERTPCLELTTSRLLTWSRKRSLLKKLQIPMLLPIRLILHSWTLTSLRETNSSKNRGLMISWDKIWPSRLRPLLPPTASSLRTKRLISPCVPPKSVRREIRTSYLSSSMLLPSPTRRARRRSRPKRWLRLRVTSGERTRRRRKRHSHPNSDSRRRRAAVKREASELRIKS